MNLKNLFIESESLYPFEETIEKISESITNSGWKIPAIHDLQNTMNNFGIMVMPVKVFELCHPKHSSRLLTRNNERIASAMMPCRISVYKKDDGKTYISRINSAFMASSLEGLISEVMSDSTLEMENIIKNLVK